jgi:hypothetical protein
MPIKIKFLSVREAKDSKLQAIKKRKRYDGKKGP